jgi:hypothetical protein
MQVIEQRYDPAGVEAHAVSTAGKDREKGSAQRDLIDVLLQHLDVRSAEPHSAKTTP